jgi:hypothetical protein
LQLAVEGEDHVAGTRGYKMLRAQFVHRHVMRARDERLIYFSVHNHGGTDSVSFSSDDLASHERGYPALLDVVRGMPVGALVLARDATAGIVWLPKGRRVPIDRTIVVGEGRSVRFPRPRKQKVAKPLKQFDRQVLLFGERGQDILAQSRVGIVGVGGIGMQLAELLGRLGVGRFVLIDPDRVDVSNLSRLVGARRTDALVSEDRLARLGSVSRWFAWLRRRKVDLAKRCIRRANRNAQVTVEYGSVADARHAMKLLDCDYIFLAADQMTARLVFNSIVHQYLIPGVQVGARVVTDENTGNVTDVFAVSRPVYPDSGCLWCNNLIDPTKLQLEATDREQALKQMYGTESAAPSVVTLNGLSASEAANDFLFYITGLSDSRTDKAYMRFRPIRRSVQFDEPSRSAKCTECGRTPASRFGRGDGAGLPTRN